MPDETLEFDNTAFVVYVPKMGGDPTVESCIRLGAGPSASNMSTADENTTYNDAVAAASALGGLSYETYHPHSGIALLTPGTINLVAANGVNVTSASTFTNSTTGSTYTITQDPNSKHVISASYTSADDGTWGTSSFNKAVTVAVNTVPLQAAITFGPTYAVSGPLTLTNNWGVMWNSTVGFSVTAQLARVTNIGWHTIVANDWDGSSNQYYTAKQASSTAAQFKWLVPVAGLYADFDTTQNTWCKIVNAAAMAADAAATAYALGGLIAADRDHGSPEAVKSWLNAAEPVAIVCTAIDGLLCVGGILLGYLLVDKQADDQSPANEGATTFVIGDGTFDLKTATPLGANARSRTPSLKLDRSGGKVTISTGAGASITLEGSSITIAAATVTVQSPSFQVVKPPPGAGAGDLAPDAPQRRYGGGPFYA